MLLATMPCTGKLWSIVAVSTFLLHWGATVAQPSTAPSFNTTRVGVCNFASTSTQADCMLTPLATSTFLEPGELRYVEFTNGAVSPSGVKWTGYQLALNMSNPAATNQMMAFVFGVANSTAAARACLTSFWSNGASCEDGVSIWNTAIYRKWPVINTVWEYAGSLSYDTSSGGVAYLISKRQLTERNGSNIIAFMGSLSSRTIGVNLSTPGVVPTFAPSPPAPPPSSRGARVGGPSGWLVAAAAALAAALGMRLTAAA